MQKVTSKLHTVEDIVSYGAFTGGQGRIPPVAERGNWHVVKILPASGPGPGPTPNPNTVGLREPVPAFMSQYIVANATAGFSTWETCNYNNYSPLETARYLMAAGVDPDWREHAEQLTEFVQWTLIDNPLRENPNKPGVSREGHQWGARAVSEQAADVNRMVSHTSRYASVLARLAERTANHSLGAIARRSWDWSSYMSDARGRVVVGPVDQSMVSSAPPFGGVLRVSTNLARSGSLMGMATSSATRCTRSRRTHPGRRPASPTSFAPALWSRK